MIDKIYEILEEMEDELDGAEKYAHKAMHCAKSSDGGRPTMYVNMAEDELGHFNKLDSMLKTHIASLEGDMKKFVELHHSMLMKEYSEIKFLLSKASEN
jgi:hypothetical protein